VHPYDDPFPPDGEDSTREPAPARAAGAGGYRPGPLEAVAGAFRLLVTGPQPLALQAGRLAGGLPDRLVPLDELTVLLLHPSVSTAARNKVWAELVRRARSGSPAWTVGLTGVALPGLTRAVASLAAAYRGDPGDLETEVLAGFLAALRALDPDELDSIPAGLPADLGRVPGRPGAGLLRRRVGSPPPRPGRVLPCAGPAVGAPGLRAGRRGPPRRHHRRRRAPDRRQPARRHPPFPAGRRNRQPP
jgi:hypothetical protein